MKAPAPHPDGDARERRYLMVVYSSLPLDLAARFTPGQLAALRIVADEVATKGIRGLCINAIVARARICQRFAQMVASHSHKAR